MRNLLCTPMRQRHDITVAFGMAGMRLDAFVVAALAGLTRSQVKRLIEEGRVTVNGRIAKVAHKVAAGDHVVVGIPPPVEPSAVPEDIPLDILYEDSDIIVINKPAGMVVHPAAGHPRGTLVNALLAHCKDLSGIGGELKPGIVHRLDQGTSGAIVAAKNDNAHRSLASQFKARTVTKVYLALVFGRMSKDQGRLDLPIGRSTRHRKRMSVHTRRGREAITRWRVVERFGEKLSLLEVCLHTGRMHQIRVHLTELGHPLVGDPLYGGARGRAEGLGPGPVREVVKSFSRPALHAWRLGFDHPVHGKRMEFVADIPADMKTLLKGVRNVANQC